MNKLAPQVTLSPMLNIIHLLAVHKFNAVNPFFIRVASAKHHEQLLGSGITPNFTFINGYALKIDVCCPNPKGILGIPIVIIKNYPKRPVTAPDLSIAI